MRRAIQSLVSRQSVLAQTQPPFMIYLASSYVCSNCRYLLERRLSGDTAVAPAGQRGEKKIHRLQQRRGIHISVRNLKKAEWKGFRKVGKGRDSMLGKTSGDKGGGGRGGGEKKVMGRERIQLRDVELSFEEWRYINDRAAHFSQLRDESSVASPESLGTKLVDERPFVASSELWHMMLTFRRRLYEGVGVKEIWDGMQLRGIDLPTRGKSANEFWGIFLRSALQDDAFLQEIWKYIQDLDSRENHQSWNGIYDTIIGHFLLTDPSKVRPWHCLLYPRHTSRSLRELFTTILQQRSDVHIQLREIHATTKAPAGIYSTMIPLLCTMGSHAEAVRWHRHCLSFADLPKDTSAANDLIRWTAKYGTIEELRRLLYSFVETRVKVVESSLVAIIIARPDKMEALRFVLARSNEFDTTAMGDIFWAHVVNQRNLEKVDIYRYLETFGPGLAVGQQTVEAIVRRFEIPEDKAVWLLTEIGITIREDEFVPKSPTPAAYPQSLEVAERGPQTMEELETSLQEYLAAKAWKKFDATLRFPAPGPPSTSVYNIILQADLTRCRLRESLHRIEHMRMHSIVISTPSLQLMIKTLLRPRTRGSNPDTRPWYLEDDLFLVIGLLFSLLRSDATKVEPHLWTEIFKRLGMSRRLLDIEALAMGLVEWYHPVRSISTRRRFARTTITPPISAAAPTTIAGVVAQGVLLPPAPPRPVEIPDRSKQNPLRRLFPKAFFQAIVEWGFLTFRPYSPITTPLIPPPPPLAKRRLPRKYEEFAGCVSRFTWGIGFAKQLHDLGVFVDPRVITRAIRVRLGPILSTPSDLNTLKNINQLSSIMSYLTLEEVVVIVEKAWGGKLYERDGWKNKVVKRKITCECGKNRFEVEDGEKQKYERDKRDKAMRKEVLGDAPEVKMERRWKRMMKQEALRNGVVKLRKKQRWRWMVGIIRGKMRNATGRSWVAFKRSRAL